MLKIFKLFRPHKLRDKIVVVFVIAMLVIGIAILIALPTIKTTIIKSGKKELVVTTNMAGILVESLYENAIRNYMRGISETHLNTMKHYYAQFQAGKISEDETKKLVEDVFLSHKVGKTGYMVVTDISKGRSNITATIHPFVKGKRVEKFGFIQDMYTQKEGYFENEWKNPNDPIPRIKAGYMTYFEPWKWIISVNPYKDEFMSLINIKEFKKSLSKVQPTTLEGSYIAIFNTKGDLIYHPSFEEKSAIDVKDAKTGAYFIREMLSSIKEGKNENIVSGWKEYTFKQRGKETQMVDKLMYYKYIPSKDWIITTIINKDEILKPYTALSYQLTIIAITLFLVMSLLALISARYLTHRIKELVKAAQNLSNNNYDIKLNRMANDEVGDLEDSFSTAAKTIENLIIEQKELNTSLEEKVNYRTKELEIEKYKAQEATKSKSEFLANMSHEIRTPMNGIIGMTHLAIESNKDLKQEKYLNTINNSANALLNIINDILDFSKIEAGKLNINKIDFNLSDLLKDTSSLVEFKALEKDLNFDVTYPSDLNLSVNGDDLRIRQILINLINNAIKFTHNGYIKISIENSKDDIYTFRIEDSGIGMTKESVDNLFHAFNQADGSTTRRYGGTGLGLSISKQLIELMDGKIWVESQENQGSSFYFSLNLPNAQNEIQTSKVEKLTQNDICTLKGSNILLVEDNLINQEIIIGLLEKSGIHIDIANNGYEAINSYAKNNYELILMDIQMPVMDGIEATKHIRETNKDIPIIALTANAMKEDREKTQEAGMNEHLNKPIDVKKLYETLLKYIKSKSNRLKSEDNKSNVIVIPEFKNIDTKIGLGHMGENKKLYLKILNDFYNTYNSLNLNSLNEDEFKRTIHTLKGLSSNIGAIKLHNITKDLEKSNDKNLIDLFNDKLQDVINEIKDIV